MSLRARLLAAIFLALLISFSLGAGFAAWRTTRTVHDELAAALVSGRQAMLASLAVLPDGVAGRAQLRHIVAAFDGDRHLQAALLGPDGTVLAISAPGTGRLPPAWFLRVAAPSLATAMLTVRGVPGVAALRLAAAPASEVGERWTELSERMAGFAMFFAAAALLCSVTVASSLRPLTSLAQALARVEHGDLGADLAQAGPPEIAALASAFNRMATALRAAERQNNRLSQQILTVAEEERAEIARDLHDEIGPSLFAITAFAATAGRLVESRDLAAVPAQLTAIQAATARIQAEVRDMLQRLHAGVAAPTDLAAAVDELVGFWRGVRPETEFSADVALPQAGLSAAITECLFRAAQEGVSNAVRHGRPRRVWLRASMEDGMAVLTVQDDGVGGGDGPGDGLGDGPGPDRPGPDRPGADRPGPDRPRMGLAGMRARAASLGGRVDVRPAPGWRVTVRVPLAQAA
jgi:two-component system sensor histidine kinase UhpB